MRIKPGTLHAAIHPSILHALDIADYLWRDIAKREATVTSLHDSEHSANSLHYGRPGDIRCRAVDLRINDVPAATAERLVENLKLMLGDAFDVILESDHIHIEYDPWP